MEVRILNHLLTSLAATPAIDEPFSHFFMENVFPDDVYKQLLQSFPAKELYAPGSEKHYGDAANSVRGIFPLDHGNLAHLPGPSRAFWSAIAGALASPALKQAVFEKLAADLVFRFGVAPQEVADLPGYARPTLYRETEGYEIPPHPDTRSKVITMHLYFPEDESQLDLGTALYRRRVLSWPFAGWQKRFEKVKQFPFKPNSAYAFVVNNALTKKSWHGREKLPPGGGVRNTLLNIFFASPKEGFGDPHVTDARRRGENPREQEALPSSAGAR